MFGISCKTFEVKKAEMKEARFAQGLFGYTTYDAVQFFETTCSLFTTHHSRYPLMRYRLYQYVIAINHFKDELFICENKINGLKAMWQLVESLIRSKDVPVYPFQYKGEREFQYDR